MQGNNCRIGDVREGAPECERGFTKKAGLRYRVCFTIDIIAKGIGNASNFYGRAVYYPNYSTRPPHNGREVRAASRSCSTLGATALSLLPLLQIDSLQIVRYCNEEHGQCL